MNIQDWAAWATIVGLPIVLLGLWLSAQQLRQTRRTVEVQLLLELRSAFAMHSEVNNNLRPNGAWVGNAGPDNVNEWAMVDAYLGLFEVCNRMLTNEQLSSDMFRNQYYYRLQNIRQHTGIVAHIVEEREHWTELIALFSRFDELRLPEQVVVART